MESRLGQYSVVQAETPRAGPGEHRGAVARSGTDSLRLRFRRDLESLVDEEEDREVLADLADDLAGKAREMGAEKLFEYLESNLSGAIRLTDREEVLVEDFDACAGPPVSEERAKQRAGISHASSEILAAGGGREISREPGDFRRRLGGSAGRPAPCDRYVCGANRGPLHGAADSRRIAVRVSATASPDRARAGWCWPKNLESHGNNRYAVKRYRSEKSQSEADWKHQRIRLESLNPEYPSWDLDPDEEKYRILAEFVRVLD